MRVPDIRFEWVTAADEAAVELIAQWCLTEWAVPVYKTRKKFLNLSGEYFHLLMFVDGIPIAAGGIHPRVSLQDKIPRLEQYRHWLALVYTIPEERGKGYGAFLCKEIQEQSNKLGIKELTLFTHTAERLYARLGWELTERVSLPDHDIAIMKLLL